MVDWKANFEIFLAVSVLGFALLQSVVAGVSFARLRSRRILLISLGFAAFTLKGLYLTLEAYRLRANPADWILVVGLFDLAVLLLLYFAVRNR